MNNHNENLWYLWLSIILIAVITFPYLLGFELQTDDLKFSGSFIGVDDQNSYLAKMRAGYAGEWLNQSPYTNFPQNSVAVYLPFVYLGKLAGGENLVGQFQFFMLILRVAGLALYVFALRKFFDLFLDEFPIKKIAIILVLFGGGFGFLYFAGLSSLWNGRLPLEVYSPEAFSFLALLTLPHIIIARSFLLLSLTAWISKKEIKIGKLKFSYIFQAIIYSYLIFLFQPITLSILLGIIGVYILVQISDDYFVKKEKLKSIFQNSYFKETVLYFVVVIPAIAYNLYLLLFDPYIKAWGAQNELISAPITDYLLAYVIYIVLFVVYLFIFVVYLFIEKNIRLELKVLGLWIVLSLIGIYLPISIQRRFIEGSWVFLILFSMLSIQKVVNVEKHKVKMRIAIIPLLFSSIFLYAGTIFQIISTPNRVFIDSSKIELYKYIENTIKEREFVFANHEIGNEIPVWTNARTVTGVGPESINEQDYLAMYSDYVNGTINKKEFEKNLSSMSINFFVIENPGEIDCDLLFENSKYVLCRVGENE